VLYDKDKKILFDVKEEISGLKSSEEWICFNHTLENPKGYLGKNSNFQIFEKKIIREMHNGHVYYGDKFSTTKVSIHDALTKI
ncbi:hypothetical protein, partial [Flavobacterium sp. 3-210]